MGSRPRRSCFPLILTGFCLLVAGSAFARERHEFFDGVRANGMGGVTIPTVNDETALVTNPAALGRLRDFYGTVLDPDVAISSNDPGMNRNTSISQPFGIESAVRSAVASQDTYYHSRAQLMPSLVARNFGIGLFGKYELDARAKSATEVDTFYRDDLALLLGYNLRLWGGRIKIGVTGKVISRVELNEEKLDSTKPMDLKTLATTGKLKEGVGAGSDVSLMLTAPWTYLPTLTAVVHDVGGTSFDQAHGVRNTDATTRPDIQSQDMDVGASVSPIHSQDWRSTWGVEYRHVLTSDSDKAKLVHVGVEVNYSDVAFVRVGYNQRYWTAGFELATEHVQFQTACYGVEVGDETAPREDRRYEVKLAYRF